MAYEQDLLEKIEYLRSKAVVGYEEAARLLERFDGDLTRVLVELERSGRVRPEATYDDEAYTGEPYHDHHDHHGHNDPHTHQEHRHGHGAPTFKRKASSILSKLMRNRIVVLKNDSVIANFTFLYCIVAVMMAPHLLMLSVVLMFLCGYRITRKIDRDGMTEFDVEGFVDKTAKNIKRTVTSFSEGRPEAVKPEKAEPYAPPVREVQRPISPPQRPTPVYHQRPMTPPPPPAPPTPPQATEQQDDDEGGEITIE